MEAKSKGIAIYVDFKANGSIHRFGFSHLLVQDRTQSVIHKWFGHYPKKVIRNLLK